MSTKNLEELNAEEAKQYIGGVVFVTILMVLGIIGNLHVIFVYTFKMKPSNHRIFILVLAVLDLITCTIGMPFIVVDLRNPLTFTMVSACKVLRFINYFICTSSALILLVIAIERYRKICMPLGRQISQQTAKFSCLIVLVVALLLSWPAPVLFGGSTVKIAGENVTGTRCYTEDRFKDTKYQAYFNAVLILVVFGVFIVLVILYSLIGRVIFRHSTFNFKNKRSTAGESTTSSATVETKECSMSSISTEKTKCSLEPPSVSTGSASRTENENTKTKETKKETVMRTSTNDRKVNEQNKFSKMRKTTYMLFMITVVFFVSYFPHLILKIVTFSNKNFVPNMTFAGRVLYNTFIWCFFINNAANSIIYGFCDARFREEVLQIYRNLFKRIRN